MGKLTKNQKLAAEKIEAGKAYSLKEAAQLVKDITFSKLDRKSTRLNSSHDRQSRMPSSA